MNIWHLTPDAPRRPQHPSPGEPVRLCLGTYPIEPGQLAWVDFRITRADGTIRSGRATARWERNEGRNSYWWASIGPFGEGNRVWYRVAGSTSGAEVVGPDAEFLVGPKLYLAVLWHHHQPLYRDLATPSVKGAYRFPWVRLHAIRDYYAMAALVAEHPAVHLTINLVPSLLWQIEDYVERGATDRALDLTLTPTKQLSDSQKSEILEQFFQAHWHWQIFPYSRYEELFQRRIRGEAFRDQDFDDLKMWFNLCWFAPELQKSDAVMPDGSIVSVKRFFEQGAGFTQADLDEMVEQQYKMLRNVVPIHRALQDRGQIEVSTTPFFHPILPLLDDTDRATIDREGSTHPPRFAYPEDARVQISRSMEYYRALFGRAPRGMWPAEGAVSQSVVPLFEEAGLLWIATDRGVLQRSGRWGYRVDDPDVLCRPYRVGREGHGVAAFFRDTALSDRIGFRYQDYTDEEQAAAEFVAEVKAHFASRVDDPPNRVLSVILDGENAWSAYREAARPFLHALYRRLGADPEIRTVTYSEYLLGNPDRNVRPHPASSLDAVADLFCGSWIDELGSRPGVDLGTWIGEPDENRAWELLGEARRAVADRGATPQSHPLAFEALYAAEGSDWFWWYGSDHDSEQDEAFDDLFRAHLAQVYRGLGEPVPGRLSRHIVPHTVVWSFERPLLAIQPSDRLAIHTHCRGVLTWGVNGWQTPQDRSLLPVGGVMAGIRRYRITLGPFDPTVRTIEFSFRCGEPGCLGDKLCCRRDAYTVRVEAP